MGVERLLVAQSQNSASNVVDFQADVSANTHTEMKLPKRRANDHFEDTIQKNSEAAVKKAGLVMRVSTDRQAQNEEGSLKNQLQRLRQHIEYKNTACGGKLD